MDERRIEEVIAACERALAAGGKVDLPSLRFWGAVEAVKRRPDLVERYAERVAAVDRDAFVRNAPLVFPAALGVVLLALGTLAGVVLVAAAVALGGAGTLAPEWAGLVLLAGAGALVGATHGLTHFLVGVAVGIRFTHWFSLPPRRPQPGFKVDYASYLRTPPRARAWMHGSAPLLTKLLPFALLPLFPLARAPLWAGAVLGAIGLVQLATDALLSVRFSDWKRFRREMRVAREIEARG